MENLSGRVDWNSTVLTRNTTDFLHANLDGEMVLMHIETAEYYGMDKTTTHIWEILEEIMSLDQLINKLVSIYEVDSDICQSQVQPVLEDMLDKKFLLVASN